MTNRTRLLLLAGLALAALAQARDKPYDPAAEGYVVIGIAPGDYVVEISVGDADDKLWTGTKSRPAFAGRPKDGYIVARVPANTDLAITRIRPPGKRRSGWTWCRTTFTPLLKVAPGHVAYFADITYHWPEDFEPWFTTAIDFDRARAHVEANYPQLRGLIEQGEWRTVRPQTGCGANGSVS